MGKNNRYAAPVTESQPDTSNTGTAQGEAVDVVVVENTDTVQQQEAAALSSEEVAALAESAAKIEATDKEPSTEEKAVEEPRPAETVVLVPTPVQVPVVATVLPVVVPPTIAPVAVAAPVVATPTRVTPTTPLASDSELSNRLERLKLEGTAREKALITFIEGYITSMTPGKPVEDKAGATHQLTLWRTLQSVVERSAGDEFRNLFSLVLDIVAEHQHKRGVFQDKYVFRFVEHLTFSAEEQKSFLALLNLMVLTANRNTRHIGKKQIDLNRVAGAGFSEQGRQNLLAFYK
jgi:hypothetical protein